MKRLMFIGVGVAVLAGGIADTGFAQRDAGAKARGDFGRGFWNSGGGRTYAGPSYQYQPGPAVESFRSYSYAPVETHRSFSYAPVDIAPGETVVVRPNRATVMMGQRQVGTLPQGETFEVTRVVNGWLGVVTEVDGQRISGWVWNADVAPEGAAIGDGAATGAQSAVPSPDYRRFSYEPTVPSYQPAYVPPMTGTVQPQRAMQRPSPPEVRLRPGSRSY